MDIHQCTTCGERWRHGKPDAQKRVNDHTALGHKVVVGEEKSLDAQMAKRGIEVKWAARKQSDVLTLYRCIVCGWEIEHDGTEEAYNQHIEHNQMPGHRVLIGEASVVRGMSSSAKIETSQAPNPVDPESRPGGVLQTFGETERTA